MLTHCSVCLIEQSKYTCPSCSARSCSLICVNQHKLTTFCSGISSKTSFVRRAEFNMNNLLSDYQFLEGVNRTADNASRENKIESQSATNKRVNLVRMAKQKGIMLNVLPSRMKRHSMNQSTFNKQTNCILWTVEIVFNDTKQSIMRQRFSETMLIEDLLPTSLLKDLANRINVSDSAHQREDYKFYMKRELVSANKPEYYQFQPKMTLLECLKGKMIFEFPTIVIQSQEMETIV